MFDSVGVILPSKLYLFSANCTPAVVEYSSLKRAVLGDSVGTVAKKQTTEKHSYLRYK